jgi:hypothetical protein
MNKSTGLLLQNFIPYSLSDFLSFVPHASSTVAEQDVVLKLIQIINSQNSVHSPRLL